jgi:hypothetical protein
MSIKNLKSDIESALLKIAPERSASLCELIDVGGFSFEWSNRNPKIISVDTKNKKIKLAWRSMELLWSACYQNWIFYTDFSESSRQKLDNFDLVGSRERLVALLVFRQAVLSHHGHFSGPIDGLPQADSNPDSETIQIVNELMLSALGWILHHELAHLRCGHSNIPNREEEKEADIEATKWIFSEVIDNAERKKAILMIKITRKTMSV